jgi:hypothetical protein
MRDGDWYGAIDKGARITNSFCAATSPLKKVRGNFPILFFFGDPIDGTSSFPPPE